MNQSKGRGKRREEHSGNLQVIFDRRGDFPGHADKHEVTIPACRAKPYTHVSGWEYHHRLLSPPPPSHNRIPRCCAALRGCDLCRKARRGSGGGKEGQRTLARAATEVSKTGCGILFPAFKY